MNRAFKGKVRNIISLKKFVISENNYYSKISNSFIVTEIILNNSGKFLIGEYSHGN